MYTNFFTINFARLENCRKEGGNMSLVSTTFPRWFEDRMNGKFCSQISLIKGVLIAQSENGCSIF